jgi:geranylgeranyl reductase family protein
LAKAGVRVGILDAKTFPRQKACGGGIQEKAARRIPFEWRSVVRGDLHGMAFSFKMSDHFSRKHTQPLVHSVLRTEFDELLLRTAQNAGAQVMEGVKAIDVLANDSTATVVTESGDLTARFAIGADGANSITRRFVNSRVDYFWQAGLYCEVPERYLIGDYIDYDCMRVDWGFLPSGYAWIFPKRDYVNVGVGFPASIGSLARPYLIKFLRAEKILQPHALENLKFTGHQLPTLTKATRLSKGAVLLVGDSAGLIEPFTGDGISYALHSSAIAADVILRNLECRIPDLIEYDKRVMREIAPEIFASRQLMSLFIAFPRTVHEIFRQNDKVWAAFCRVLRGEDSFRVFRRKKFGALEFLWFPVDVFVRRFEKRRLNNPSESEKQFALASYRLFRWILRKI